MTTIVSKRGFIKFYILVGFMFFFCLAMGASMLIVAFREKGLTPAKNNMLYVFGVLFIFFGFYSIYRYVKNAPAIRVDKKGIQFNDTHFLWEELEEISLTSKMPFKYIFGFPMEGAMFRFSNSERLYFFDSIYSNTWQIKSFIQQCVIEKKEVIDILELSPTDHQLQLEDFEIYKGNQLTSFRGISLWGFFVFIIFLVITKQPKWNSPQKFLIFIGVFGGFWFLFNSYLMHYFGLSPNYFAIKNHNFFWFNKYYKISNIREITFETQGKMPNCLRVITKDFRNKLYPAGTLRDENWLELKEQLENRGVTVRNELYLE